MNHMRKKAAVSKYRPALEAGATAEELQEQIIADGYTEDETKEILNSLAAPGSGEDETGNIPPAGPLDKQNPQQGNEGVEQQQPQDQDLSKNQGKEMSKEEKALMQSSNQEPLAESQGDKGKKVRESPYKAYDLWEVRVDKEERIDPVTRTPFAAITGFTAIIQKRKNVKLEPTLVDELNAQSHNNLLRYYPAGKITNGDFESVDIQTTKE